MIKYGAVKGKSLSEEDLDTNFKELELRIDKLEKEKQLGMANLTLRLEGDLLIQDDGLSQKTLGRLPMVSLNPKGLWRTGNSYMPFDLVLDEGEIFFCQHAHISKETREQDSALWTLFFKLPKGDAQ